MPEELQFSFYGMFVFSCSRDGKETMWTVWRTKQGRETRCLQFGHSALWQVFRGLIADTIYCQKKLFEPCQWTLILEYLYKKLLRSVDVDVGFTVQAGFGFHVDQPSLVVDPIKLRVRAYNHSTPSFCPPLYDRFRLLDEDSPFTRSWI